jgi:hypothetical protein
MIGGLLAAKSSLLNENARGAHQCRSLSTSAVGRNVSPTLLRYRDRSTAYSCASGILWERVVLSDGLSLCGHYFPENERLLVCSPSVIGFKKEVYGQEYAVEDF